MLYNNAMSKLKTKLSIAYLDRDSLPRRISVPAPRIPHEWRNYPATAPHQAAERSRDIDVLIVNKVAVTAELLHECPKLKHIVVSATGVNIVDINACEARGISVSNVPSYAADTVSEHVIGSAIILRRELLRYADSVTKGEWQKSDAFCLFDKPFNNIRGATIGLIGLGEIGEATAKRAHAMGMNVLFCARSKRTHDYAKQVELQHLLRHSDIVSVHCSLNESTQGLIGIPEISAMPAHSVLINTARGGIVDEVAATRAIENETIAGLAFDVMVEEPPKDSAPLLSIAHLPNVLLTPHIAWASEQAMQYLADTVSRNIEAYANGTPINLVTKH